MGSEKIYFDTAVHCREVPSLLLSNAVKQVVVLLPSYCFYMLAWVVESSLSHRPKLESN